MVGVGVVCRVPHDIALCCCRHVACCCNHDHMLWCAVVFTTAHHASLTAHTVNQDNMQIETLNWHVALLLRSL